MKITIDFDISPSELREVFGLPDLQPLHDEVLEKIRDRVLSSVDDYDPMQFMAAYTAEGARNIKAFQDAMWKGFSGGAPNKDDSA